MTKIQILGSGCAKCNKMAETAETAAKEMGIEFDLEKITDLDSILKFGVMITPALVIDGVVKVSGRVPRKDDMIKMLS